VITTIPRDQILEVMERYNDCWDLREDPPAVVVRHLAMTLATGAAEERAEAVDLHELVDRIEASQ
jgi:hypothetical protein